jgi:hypothetical protein
MNKKFNNLFYIVFGVKYLNAEYKRMALKLCNFEYKDN